MNFDNVEYTNKLKYANECLGICDDLNVEKNRNIVFIYSPPKVGSTTLVSSIRLSAAHKFTVQKGDEGAGKMVDTEQFDLDPTYNVDPDPNFT